MAKEKVKKPDNPASGPKDKKLFVDLMKSAIKRVSK